jgi:hypothetical protein
MGEVINLADARIKKVLLDAPASSAEFKQALHVATVSQLERVLASLINSEFPHGGAGDRGRVHMIRKRINKLGTG